MFLIDSHCHLDRLDLEPYDNNLSNALTYANEVGVGHMLCVSINMENFKAVIDTANKYDFVSASVGVHPNDNDGHDPSTDELIALADDKNIVAIGETGLDYFRSEGDLSWQQDRFRRHITASKETKKPLIIHMRDATDDTLRILKEERADEAGGAEVFCSHTIPGMPRLSAAQRDLRHVDRRSRLLCRYGGGVGGI